jgi:hypothetical protein
LRSIAVSGGCLVSITVELVVVLKSLTGGGEVSGGGTLYMKWGAGLLTRREC